MHFIVYNSDCFYGAKLKRGNKPYEITPHDCTLKFKDILSWNDIAFIQRETY